MNEPQNGFPKPALAVKTLGAIFGLLLVAFSLGALFGIALQFAIGCGQ